ncbi:hypothetical protein AAF712_001449 [Marasmius tenuissimus]|uniref:Uncharacterized protein n=1 Tax=Marasmius tenuissimus TaxID=585030 RepID=A0ABR3AG77_9AGAR
MLFPLLLFLPVPLPLHRRTPPLHLRASPTLQRRGPFLSISGAWCESSRNIRENGITQPLRSIVATELVAQDSKVYENAGVTTFWELFRLAIKEQLVWWGDQGDDVWVALRDSAAQLQSLAGDTPLDPAILMPPTTPASKRNDALVASTTSTTDSTHTPPVHVAAAIAVTDESTSPTSSPAQNNESIPASRCAYDKSQNQTTGPLNEPLPPLPVPAAPSPPPLNAPTSPQSQFITPEVRAVPRHLRSLVLILQEYRQETGDTQPLWGSIA